MDQEQMLAMQGAIDDKDSRITDTIAIAEELGQIDGSHHKAWIIDQMIRKLLGIDYNSWVESYEEGGEYEWDVGIAP